MFVALMLIARGLPVMILYRRVLAPPERLPMALFSATGLPLIVVITSIATAEGKIRPVNAAALVAAGMVTVLVFPATGFWRMRKIGAAEAMRGRPPDPGEGQGVLRCTLNQSRAPR